MKYPGIWLVLFVLSLNVNGQEGKSYTQKKEEATAYLKNTKVTIDDQTYDYRVLRHYTEQTLRTMSPVKRKQMLFIYTESYRVTDAGNCPSLKPIDIDVAQLEIYRKENEDNTVEFGKDCKVHVELMARKTLKQKMEELTK